MSKNIIFVTGYFGAPIREIAEKTAEREGCALLSLDEEIERADGRSILRICMLMGEHEYRNKEYEILAKLTSDDQEGRACASCCSIHMPGSSVSEKSDGSVSGGSTPDANASNSSGSNSEDIQLPADDIVVYCGDGVLNDEMSRDIILKHRLVIAGVDMSVDELWENARKTKDSAHAFMHFGSEESQKKAFEDLCSRQRALYDSIGL